MILQILVLLTVIIYAEGRGARMAALISDPYGYKLRQDLALQGSS